MVFIAKATFDPSFGKPRFRPFLAGNGHTRAPLVIDRGEPAFRAFAECMNERAVGTGLVVPTLSRRLLLVARRRMHIGDRSTNPSAKPSSEGSCGNAKSVRNRYGF
jgi:hypothetical protein